MSDGRHDQSIPLGAVSKNQKNRGSPILHSHVSSLTRRQLEVGRDEALQVAAEGVHDNDANGDQLVARWLGSSHSD